MTPVHDEIPWWELKGLPPPHDARYEAERERLRLERARAHRKRLAERDRRRERSSVPPPREGK